MLDLVDVDIDAPRWGEPGEASIEHCIEPVWTLGDEHREVR